MCSKVFVRENPAICVIMERSLRDVDILQVLENSDNEIMNSEDEEDIVFDRESPAQILNESVDDITDFMQEEDDQGTGNQAILFSQDNISAPSDSRAEAGWSMQVNDLPGEQFTGWNILPRQLIHFDDSTSIFSIFRQIVDDKVIKLMVEQTNIYARRLKETAPLEFSRIKRWSDVTEDEMLKFIGMLLFTGLVKFPTLECYWKKDQLYFHPLLHNVKLSYNRFAILLKCWHFADNEAPRSANDRLYKIKPLVDLILGNSRGIYTPGRIIVVDESMVHFRGRLLFRQYIPSKAHKYGIKIYKLCTIDGFVWGYEIYCGQSQKVFDLDISGSIVARLAESLLDEGRLIITDNFYTSIPLAEFLKSRCTDLLGTVNKKGRACRKQL